MLRLKLCGSSVILSNSGTFRLSKNHANSISKQLLTGLLIPLCSLLLISTIVAYTLAAWFAGDAHDQNLLNSAHNVAARLTEDKRGLVAELPKNVQAVLRHNDSDKFFYQVLGTDNVRLAGDAILPMPIGPLETEIPRFRNAVVNGMPVRMARITVELRGKLNRTVIVQVATTLNSRTELINKIFLSIVIPQLVLGVLSVLAVWFGVANGLMPLRALSNDIQSRSQVDLTRIDGTDTPIEVQPIINALNNLFGRLEAHIDAQQRFVANAAHQLRTPVAGLKAYIEYGRRVNNGKMKEVLDQLDNGVDRISELVAGLLVLARAANLQAHNFEPLDLNFVASEVSSELMREAANKQIELSFHPSHEKAPVTGDPSDLREMITNLVENAIRYTPVGGKVDVSLDAGPPVILSVKDNGPGIPANERERVFERFYRVLGTKVNGSGLGLAIVSEIAQAHKATVELTEGADGCGTLARVTFTAVPTETYAATPTKAMAPTIE